MAIQQAGYLSGWLSNTVWMTIACVNRLIGCTKERLMRPFRVDEVDWQVSERERLPTFGEEEWADEQSNRLDNRTDAADTRGEVIGDESRASNC